jgi:integrase
MANINFVLREPFKKGSKEKVAEQKKKGGRIDNYFNSDVTPILLHFGFDRTHRFKCKTDLKIHPKEWDFKKQRKKFNLNGSYELNDRLDALSKNVTDYYNKLISEFPDITFNSLKEKLTEFVKADQNPNFEEGTGFFDVMDKYIEGNKTKVSHRTIQKYNTFKKSLENFSNAKKNYRNLTFSQIDLNFYDEYKNYLLLEVENPKTGCKGYLNDTVSKYIENLKNFMKWSLERKFHKNTEFQNSDFSSNRKPKQDIVTLNFSELKSFYEHDFSDDKRLEQVRDLFCFAAFTGQRWGDIANFRKDDIIGDTWVFKAEKTGKKTTVPFIGYIAPALNILKKYNFKLPEISNQKFNDYIKEAAEEAKLNRTVSIERMKGVEKIITEQPLHQFITMHTGRRTCVSLLLNVAKMPIPQVMDITQHTDFKTLRKYINEDPDALRKNLKETRSVIDFELKLIKKAQ